MSRPRQSYTRYPRPILWLIREGCVRIGGAGADSEPTFEAQVGAFYISKAPVTNLQFEAFAPEYRRSPLSPDDDGPAAGVSFLHARAYCDWYAEISRKPIRLPTEVEWEYACRAGSTTRYFFGDDAVDADRFVWHRDNCEGNIGCLRSKSSNAFGLLGALGGVWEWTGSLYRPYPIVADDCRDDQLAEGPRVLRGGSFRTPLSEMGCAVRRRETTGAPVEDVGFRIARSFV